MTRIFTGATLRALSVCLLSAGALTLIWSPTASAQSTCPIAGATCTPYNTILYGAPYATGQVSIYNDADNIYVDLQADSTNGWVLNNLLVYAGPGPIPAAPDGELLPGYFPFQTYQTNFTTFHYAFPITSTGLTCGQPIQMAVYTVATSGPTSVPTWAYGPNAYANNTFSFEYTPSCQPILTPAMAITDLKGYINSQATIKAATRNSLLVKLNSSLAALLVSNLSAACQSMQDFINLAKAQRDKKQITVAQANYMIAQAGDIRLLMGCH